MRKVHISDSKLEPMSEFRGNLGVLCLQIYRHYLTSGRLMLCQGARDGRVWRRNISKRRAETSESNETTTEELAPNPEMPVTLPEWNL